MAEFVYNIEQLELDSLAQPSKITAKDKTLIGDYKIDNVFNIAQSRVSVGVYSIDNTLLEFIPNFKGYTFDGSAEISGDRGATSVVLDPEKDIKELNYSTGDIRVLYNFTNNLFSETQKGGSFFISEISSDRTEIKASTLELTPEEIVSYVETLRKKLEDASYFSQFRVDFGENNFALGINASTLVENGVTYLTLRLYSPLADDLTVKDKFTVEEIVSDSILYEVTAQPIVDTLKIPFLKGPNFSVEEVEKSTEPTQFLNYNDLFSYPVSGSYYELFSLFNNAGAEIAVNHEDYSDFIHFSSAEERLRNFHYKLQLIESYEEAISTISASAASPSGSNFLTQISGSQSYYEGLIRGLVNNFDHYDRFLYYSSGSKAWPKSNTSRPYTNYASDSSAASDWLDVQLISASNYDVSNVDILTNTIPAFLREDPNNEQYLMFIHMIAQHFDNLWIYFKAVADKYDTDHRLNFGVSKDLVRDVVESFGVNLYSTNQNTDDLFARFLGSSFPTGSENITSMSVATSASYNSGSTALEYLQPVPKNDYEKEVYKRIYHNLPHLVKTKGTERGLRALINCFGIPESILKIRTFGGAKVDQFSFLGPDASITSSLYQSGSDTYRSGSYKIRTDNTGSYVSGSTLSRYVSVENKDKKYTDDIHNVEIAFNISKLTDDLLETKTGNVGFDIDSYIGDPRLRFEDKYDELNAYREEIVELGLTWDTIQDKWSNIEGNWDDVLAFAKSPKSFIRLLNFFDSAIFKMIKDFVPARSKVDTGIIIKSPKLHRSKVKQVEVSFTDEQYSASIQTNTVTGSSGGIYDSSGSYGYTTNYEGHIVTPLGIAVRNVTDESPMYNGELSGSLVIASDGEVGKNNPFLNLAQPIIQLDITAFNFSLPPPPACIIALTGSYLGEYYIAGVVDDTQTDETVSITYPLSVAEITSSYGFAHDFDTYEFFTIQASATVNYGDYAGYGATFTGWYDNPSGTGSPISTENPLTIYRYSEQTLGNKFYAKFNDEDEETYFEIQA